MTRILWLFPAFLGGPGSVGILVLRLVAGTGTLLLSFDSKEARDRAAGELIGESALLIQGSVAGGAR